jgi:hypothetical protein
LGSDKALVIVSTLVSAVAQPRESIQVQLTLKGSILGLIKVIRHYSSDKPLGIVNHKCAAMRLPADNRIVLFLGHGIEHLMKFPREGRRDSAFGNGLVTFLLLLLYILLLSHGVVVAIVVARGRRTQDDI